MKIIALMFAGLALSLSAQAQDWGNIDKDQLSAVMGQAQEMKACLDKVDESKLEALQAEAEGVQQKVQQLCQQGNRARAQATAVEYGQKLSADPTVKELQECAGLAGKTIPQMAWSQLEDSEDVREHVCDM